MTTKRAAVVGLALFATIALIALGVWQVQRRAWKLDLIARTEARLAAAPVAPPAAASWSRIGRDDAYRRLQVAGRWVSVAPTFVQALTDLGAGWWVMQPLRTADGTILVNRGFVPDEARGRAVPSNGPVVVTGLLRLTEPGGGFLRRNDPAHDRWYSRDVAAIATARGVKHVAPFFIDADARTSATEPRGGLTVVRFPNNHLVYALTWFTLAGMAGWFAWRALRRPVDG